MTLFGTFFTLSGCVATLSNDPTSAPAPEPQTYSLNGVKLISPEIADPNSPATYKQASYTIDSSHRLLLRFEDLSSKANSISLSSGRTVSLTITLPSLATTQDATQALELCPVTKNWMMLATWSRAHPMPTGEWSKDGGDFDSSTCVRATAPSMPAGSTVQTLSFDVTSWVVNYVKGRNENYGLILMSSNGANIPIIGDTDGNYSPRLNWLSNPSLVL